MKVEVRNNNVESALRILKRKLVEDGLFKLLSEKSYYEKPTDKRRRKLKAAVAREKKRVRDRVE